MSNAPTRPSSFKVLLFVLHFSFALAIFGSADAISAETIQRKEIQPDISIPLGGDTEVCHEGVLDTHCHYGSPAVADINGDGKLDTIVTTNKGVVYAINHAGHVLWTTDIAPAYGMGASTQEIQSGAAIADIDNDGSVEIVISNGPLRIYDYCTPGGIIVLDKNGGVKPGWPRFALDGAVAPNNCPDGIFATPALGDIDKDGQMEVVVGGFDKRLHVFNPDGTRQAGFPNGSVHDVWLINSGLHNRFADTIWSSAALADLTGDGFLEIVIGTDEGDFHGNPLTTWVCPYQTPYHTAFGPYCGGSVYALDYQGNVLPGWPRYVYEAVYSSPAIGDINNDGKPEIVFGTGEFYFLNGNPGQPTAPTAGFKVYALDTAGQDLPGWEGGKTTLGPTPASPVLGDLDNDGSLEVIMLDSSQDIPSGPYSRYPEKQSRLYAWHGNGSNVAGFPVKAINRLGHTSTHGQGKGVILADYDGDQQDEIFVNVQSDMVIVDGDGTILTAVTPGYQDPTPFYFGNGTLLNAPVAGDFDGDGRLDLVTTNSNYRKWEVFGSTSQASWPMFRANVQRTGSVFVPKPFLQNIPTNIAVPVDVDNNIDTITTSFAVEVDYTYAGTVNLSGSSGRVAIIDSSASGDRVTAQIRIDVSGLPLGTHDLTLPLQIKINSDTSVHNINIEVLIADFHNVFIPIIQR